jgi:Rieske Fe-S protein
MVMEELKWELMVTSMEVTGENLTSRSMAETSPNRRRFLSTCTAALLAVLGGLFIAPVLAFVLSPLRRKPGERSVAGDFADAGVINSFPKGNWSLHPIEIIRQDGWVKTRQSRSIWVLIQSVAPKDIQVISPICTHLGCPISWNPDAAQFRCPCHGGVFGPSGACLSGPPPRSMDRLDFEVRDDHLWVRWQDFRISVTDRVAVQV